MNDETNPPPVEPAPAVDAPPVVEAAPPEPPWAIETLAGRFVDARRGGPQVVAERVAATVKSADTAYRVHALVNAAVWPGVDPTVWKVGADSRETIPTAAPLMPALVHISPASLPAAAFRTRVVEAEVAYRFGSDLPPRAVPYTVDEVADAIETLHAAIEIVDSRIAEFMTAATSLAKLADHGVNGGFVLGDGVSAWRRIDLRKQPVTLTIDGKVHESSTGSHALGNPAVLLPWFVAWLGRTPRGVKAGDVVTTGSWTKVAEARPKSRVEVEFPGIGKAAVTFAPN